MRHAHTTRRARHTTFASHVDRFRSYAGATTNLAGFLVRR